MNALGMIPFIHRIHIYLTILIIAQKQEEISGYTSQYNAKPI